MLFGLVGVCACRCLWLSLFVAVVCVMSLWCVFVVVAVDCCWCVFAAVVVYV